MKQGHMAAAVLFGLTAGCQITFEGAEEQLLFSAPSNPAETPLAVPGTYGFSVAGWIVPAPDGTERQIAGRPTTTKLLPLELGTGRAQDDPDDTFALVPTSLGPFRLPVTATFAEVGTLGDALVGETALPASIDWVSEATWVFDNKRFLDAFFGHLTVHGPTHERQDPGSPVTLLRDGVPATIALELFDHTGRPLRFDEQHVLLADAESGESIEPAVYRTTFDLTSSRSGPMRLLYGDTPLDLPVQVVDESDIASIDLTLLTTEGHFNCVSALLIVAPRLADGTPALGVPVDVALPTMLQVQRGNAIRGATQLAWRGGDGLATLTLHASVGDVSTTLTADVRFRESLRGCQRRVRVDTHGGAPDPERSACGCAATTPPTGLGLALVAVLAARRRSRRRPRSSRSSCPPARHAACRPSRANSDLSDAGPA